MHRVLTGLAAASALILAASAAQAECYGGHDVTAKVAAGEEGVAMSTYDGTLVPPAADEAKPVQAAADCPEGVADCAPAEK